MGVSDSIVIPFYKKYITNVNLPIALLGFDNSNLFSGDLYDKKIGNWDINSDWKLDKKYKTIICTRCAYFAKDPEDFIVRCHDNLVDEGKLYVDWGLGDHWRFSNFKVGWIKNGEQEYAYEKNNYLWSTIWDDLFLKDKQCNVFDKCIITFGYNDGLKSSVFLEVPSVLELSFVKSYFNVKCHILTIQKPFLQMYILLDGTKK